MLPDGLIRQSGCIFLTVFPVISARFRTSDSGGCRFPLLKVIWCYITCGNVFEVNVDGLQIQYRRRIFSKPKNFQLVGRA